MLLGRIFAIAATAMLISSSVQAGVVLSNILDRNDISETNTNQTATARNAMGFTVGPIDLDLKKVSLALLRAESPAAINTTVSLYSNNAGSAGSIIATSGVTPVSDSNPDSVNKNAYDFLFTGVTLLAGQTYFISPDLGVGQLKWYLSDLGSPVDVGGSGFSFFGASRINAGSAGQWITGGNTAYTMELDVIVPEPAITSLLCFSGIALIRRRMKK